MRDCLSVALALKSAVELTRGAILRFAGVVEEKVVEWIGIGARVLTSAILS